MENQLSYKIFYQALGLFAVVNAFFIYMEVFYFMAVPIALVIVALALFKLDWLLMLIMFSVPISLTVEDVGGGMGLTLPTDPLLFGAMLVFVLKNLFDRSYDIKIIKNPITISVIAMLVWMFFSVLFSRLPVVSIKFFLAKLWFIIPFFFAGVLLFKNPKNIIRITWLFAVPMTGVIVYTISRQYARGFDMQA
ncbi:MAG: hypothetical protein ACPGRC_09935, partial [Salibacteraceae bacterium]